MNRVGLGLAIGAGYVLGRTKKLKLAVAVGGLVAGKRMNLSPRALSGLITEQLRSNPQFKEIGDQLRQDLRGVGKAASGAMVERQLEAFADRLHGRTAQMRDQLTGGASGEFEDEEPAEREDEPDAGAEDERRREPRRRESADRPAKKAPAKRVAKTAKKVPAKKAAEAGKAVRSTRTRLPKGGDDA